jgi:Protein of unknown function (DUF3501)
MRPLTLDDLLPLSEYAARRREFFEAHARYLNRYRRVRIGPHVSLIFENRQTLWFRVQEILRVARLSDGPRVQDELQFYNRLLPGPEQLQAALILDRPEQTSLAEELAFGTTLTGDAIALQLGDHRFPALLWTARPEDLCIGASHWVEFTMRAEARKYLADLRVPARCAVTHANYQHTSALLSEEVRQSLLEDLEPSDKDGIGEK